MKRNKSIVVISLILASIFILSGCGEKSGLESLFDDVYYELVMEKDRIEEEDLINFLDKKKDYEYTYDEKTRSYKVLDPETDNDNYVYIALSPIDAWVDSVSYYDSVKNIEVGVYNGTEDKDDEYTFWKVHIIGQPDEKVEGIDEQIEFLKTAVNETHEEVKENEHSDEPIDLEFELSYEVEDGALKPILLTNLPDGTSGSFSLSSDETGYNGSASFEVDNGTVVSDSFTNKGEALEPGTYKLEAYLPLSSIQDEEVLVQVGEDYSNYVGDEIEEGETGNIISTEMEVVIE